MSLIKKLEADVKEYASIAGKDIEHAYEDVSQFLAGKNTEAANTKAAASSASGAAAPVKGAA